MLMPVSPPMLQATATPPQHNSLRPLIQRRLPSPSPQTPLAPPPDLSPTPSPSQKTSPVSPLITSPLPAAASKTAPSPVRATPTRSLSPQQMPPRPAPSPLMLMPGSPLMLPATATPPQHNSARPLILRRLPSPSPQTPLAPPPDLSLTPSPSQKTSPVSQLITSPLPAAASKTAPSPVQATPTQSLLHQQKETKATSLWMSMPVSPLMLPATATPQQANIQTKFLIRRHLPSPSLQTPLA